jgi:hypothetical protein
MDKKAVNERRVAMIAHVSWCRICQEWREAQMSEAPHLLGRMTAPRPRSEALLKANRRHLEEVGLIPTKEQVGAMWAVVDALRGQP